MSASRPLRDLPRKLEALADLFELVDRFCAEFSVGPGPAYALRTACEEVFVNMVTHNAVSSGGITARLEHLGSALELELTDHGSGPFDPVGVPPVDREAGLEDREQGGLGLVLVDALFDEVEYAWSDGALTVRLTKELTND